MTLPDSTEPSALDPVWDEACRIYGFVGGVDPVSLAPQQREIIDRAYAALAAQHPEPQRYLTESEQQVMKRALLASSRLIAEGSAPPQPGDVERQRERLADLLRRRADVYNPKRKRNPYYGDDDIDLLRSMLDAAQSALAERDTRYHEDHRQLTEIMYRERDALRSRISELDHALAESRAEVERLQSELAFNRDLFARLRSPTATKPTDDEIQAAIKPLWLKTAPSYEAQRIRAALSADFDDPKFQQWLSDFCPDYVWDLVDIAAQRGIDLRAPTATEQATDPLRSALTQLKEWSCPVHHSSVLETDGTRHCNFEGCDWRT